MKILVTGGSGFLGLATVRKLLAEGYQVASLARKPSKELSALPCEQFLGCISDPEAVDRAMAGCTAVIHTAAKAGVWGSFEDYYRANVTGTENVLQSCQNHGVTALVHVSSPSVVFDGKDQEGVDETAPYPKRYLAYYPQTKAIAEQLVQKQTIEGLATVILRPHLIWGPGDNHLVPRVVERAKIGALRMVGDGHKLVDAVYIDNAVKAHIDALNRLLDSSSRQQVNGKIYFVTNFEPWPMERILTSILRAAGLPPEVPKAPKLLALFAVSVIEAGAKLLRREKEPKRTRFVAKQLATAHWYDNSAAANELQYEPTVTMGEGFRELAKSFGNQWQDRENPTH